MRFIGPEDRYVVVCYFDRLSSAPKILVLLVEVGELIQTAEKVYEPLLLPYSERKIGRDSSLDD